MGTWSKSPLSPSNSSLLFFQLFCQAKQVIITEHWCVRISMICLCNAGWKNEDDFIFTAVTLCTLPVSAVLCGWKFHRNAMERFTDFLARLITSLSDVLPLLTRLPDINYKIKISACSGLLRDHIIWVWEIWTVALLYTGYPQSARPSALHKGGFERTL